MLKFLKSVKVWAVILSVGAIATAVCVACVKLFGGTSINFEATFYYVCYDSPPDDTSLVSISDLVQSYGGAGYIASSKGQSFVTVACYYSQDDANSVCTQLNKKGLSCQVVKAQAPKRKLFGSAKKNVSKYEGNLNTLYSISKTCYSLANSVDNLEVGQTGAKSILKEIKVLLNGLATNNEQNCFSDELSYLITECEDIAYGYVFSYGIRRLQIAVCDCIVNANIY
ncbi:MAG: hypothetical protein ACI4MQ_00935 [Candidatus Coproplasma sp.]